MGSEVAVTAPFAGTVIAIAREPAESVRAGAALVVLEAMKMEHEVVADSDGVVRRVEVAVGDTVDEGQVLAVLAAGEAGAADDAQAEAPDPDAPRADLEAGRERPPDGPPPAPAPPRPRRRGRGRRTG